MGRCARRNRNVIKQKLAHEETNFQWPLRSRRRIIPHSPLPSRSIAALLGSGTKTGASVFPVKAFEAHIPSSLAWVPPPMNVTSSNVTSAAKDGAAVRINAIAVATTIRVGEVFIRALFEKFFSGASDSADLQSCQRDFIAPPLLPRRRRIVSSPNAAASRVAEVGSGTALALA